MPTVLLVRHGRTSANTAGVLAGWTAGVLLDDVGRGQVEALAERMSALPLAAMVSSPLQRCQDTAAGLVAVSGPGAARRPPVEVDERLGECRYGDWTGRALKSLVKEPLWKVVQAHPSAAVFPGPDGESLRAMQQRAVEAVRHWDAAVAAEHGDDALWVAVSHGDVIKSIIADAVGSHLDEFQRITVSPASVSAVRYTATRPFLLRSNDGGGDLSGFVPPPRRRRKPRAGGADAVVGGGA